MAISQDNTNDFVSWLFWRSQTDSSLISFRFVMVSTENLDTATPAWFSESHCGVVESSESLETATPSKYLPLSKYRLIDSSLFTQRLKFCFHKFFIQIGNRNLVVSRSSRRGIHDQLGHPPTAIKR